MKKLVDNNNLSVKKKIKEAEDAVYEEAEKSDGAKKEALIRAEMDLEKAEAEVEECEEL